MAHFYMLIGLCPPLDLLKGAWPAILSGHMPNVSNFNIEDQFTI